MPGLFMLDVMAAVWTMIMGHPVHEETISACLLFPML